MPARALLRQYMASVATFVVGGAVVAYLRGVKLSPVILAFTTLSLLVATGVAYAISMRKVWVAVSSEGIYRPNLLGMSAALSWSHPVLLTAVSPSSAGGTSGVTVLKVDKDGIPMAFGSVFIPRSILMSSKFQQALESYAPMNHPLRSHSQNAA